MQKANRGVLAELLVIGKRELLLVQCKLLLALIRGRIFFLFQNYVFHGIMIPLDKMHNIIMILLYIFMYDSDITTKICFHCIKGDVKKLHNKNMFPCTKSKTETHFHCVIFSYPLFIQRKHIFVRYFLLKN